MPEVQCPHCQHTTEVHEVYTGQRTQFDRPLSSFQLVQEKLYRLGKAYVDGLYAAGDVVSDLHQIAVATGHAAIAATHIHKSLPRNFC